MQAATAVVKRLPWQALNLALAIRVVSLTGRIDSIGPRF
jgi:hypothetical protein